LSWASFERQEDEDFLLALSGDVDGEPAIVHADDGICALVGYSAAELAGEPVTALFGSGAGNRRAVSFSTVLRTGEPATGGYLLATKTGDAVYTEWHVRRIEVPGGPLVIATGRRVERRRAADGDLRSLIAAIEDASDAILIYEWPAGGAIRVQYANHAAEVLTGFSRSELATASRRGPETDGDSVDAMNAAMQCGEHVRSRQRFHRRDGTGYWVEINARPLLESRPGLWRWIAIERDITEAVEREDSLAAERDAYSTLATAAAVFLDCHEPSQLDETYEKARLRLLAAGRRDALAVLESMYETALHRLTLFAATIEQRNATLDAQAAQTDAMSMLAHDIRGPLNSVIGYSELITEVDGLPDDAKEYTQLVVRAANRVVDITNEVIVAAQLDRNDYKPAIERFDLPALIESVVSLQPSGDRVTFAFAVSQLEFAGDLAGVRHIVSNLVSNALKYSGDAPVEIELRLEDDRAVIAFRDHGIGIPGDEIESIFDRFARASNARASKIRGTGLGLHFVKQLVERLNGSIAIESRIEEGTTVTVSLPLVGRSNGDEPVVVSIETAGDEHSPVAAELRKRGYPVRVVPSLAAAEVVLRHELVRLVIADDDVLDRSCVASLRTECTERGLPLLMMGSTLDDLRSDALRVPFVGDDLVSKVESLAAAAAR
jgi:PAS domain S-box-containing protein